MTVTDIAVRGKTELTISPEAITWNTQQLAALAHLGVEKATKADLAVFYHQCVKTGLDPFARQIYMIERWTKDGPKQTIQTGIDGFRLIARRASDAARQSLAFSDTLWCGEDGNWKDVWLSDKPPAAAKVTVYRNGDPFPAVAVFAEYAGRKKDGGTNAMWSSKGSLMIAKCAEALALRKAFPQDLSGIFISEEMAQDISSEAPQAPASTARSAVSRLAAVVEQKAEAADGGVTGEQLSQLASLFADRGFTDKAEGLAYIARHAGREVKASKELTIVEADAVIAALEVLGEPDDTVEAELVEAEADAALPEAGE